LSTWMVVEDEPDIYEVLLAMFEMWGIDGVAFVDGEEAVNWIDDVDAGRFKGELPELALLDIRLPGSVNGVNVAERLRQSPILKNVAIVFATAYRLNPEEEKVVMTQGQADKLMYKPLPRFNELQKILEEVIAARRAKIVAPKPK
jgi:CheY-like chemotaxis protein